MDDANVVEIPAFFQNKTGKRLTFTNEGIKFEKLLSYDQPVFIPSENISAFRYGIMWTRGYRFVFGRQYIIEIRDFDNKIFRIKLNSIYGIRRNAYHKAWTEIFDRLWANYFSNMLNYYVELYNIKQTFELADVKFDIDGISWAKKNKLLWKEIALSNYRTYFMIHHAESPRLNKSCSFANDWNALILQLLLKSIVKKYNKLETAR